MKQRPFLTIFTRACRRPVMLARGIESVIAQSCHDLEQIFAVDNTGNHPEGNILWANGQFQRHVDRVDGVYTFTLDDDGILVNQSFVAKTLAGAEQWDYPDVFLIRTISIDSTGKTCILPGDEIWNNDWEVTTPDRWSGNGYCLITRSDIWKAHVKHYATARHGGDWSFCNALIKSGCKFVRLNIIGAQSLQRGKGRVFERCGSQWFRHIVKRYNLERPNRVSNDWRLRLWRSK